MAGFGRYALYFAVFLDMAGFGMAFPDVQLRAQAFGAPGWLIGALLASYFVTQTLASPQWGKLSDRIGRKPVLLVCTALSALSMVVYAFAVTPVGILGARIMAGLAAANIVAAQAYIADNSEGDQRTKAMGQMSSAMLIGLVAGPAIGGWLAEFGGNYLLGLSAAGASTLSLIFLAVGVRGEPPRNPVAEDRHTASAFGLLKSHPDLLRLFLIATSGWFVLACLEGTFGRLIQHNLGYGQREFGLIFSYESLLGAFVGIALAWLAARRSHSYILRLGYVLQGAGLGYTPFAGNLFELFAASTVFAIGVGLTNPTLNAVGSLLAPADRQGELFGLMQATRSVGFFIGPILGGILFDWRPASPYLMAGGVALVAAALLRIPRSAESSALATASV